MLLYCVLLRFASYSIGFIVICNGRLIIPIRLSRVFLFMNHQMEEHLLFILCGQERIPSE